MTVVWLLLWDDIVGHETAKRNIRTAISAGRISHAYLFAGPRGVGKSLVALATASTLNCEHGGCGECETCSRILRGVHPDVVVLEPEQKVVTMDQVRSMRLDAYRKPRECDYKVYVIRDAERMQTETANALLKILEEPPPGVVFILLSANPESLLLTIRSRCQILYFSLILHEEIAAYLMQQGISREEAELLSRTSGGVLGRALKWASDSWRRERREVVIEIARRLHKAGLSLTLGLVEELYRQVRGPAEEVAASYSSQLEELDDGSLDSGTLAKIKKELGKKSKREQAKIDADGLREILMVLSSWYRDILVLSEGVGKDLVINVDRSKELSADVGMVETDRALECIRFIGEARRAIARNVDHRANLERTLFNIQEVLSA